MLFAAIKIFASISSGLTFSISILLRTIDSKYAALQILSRLLHLNDRTGKNQIIPSMLLWKWKMKCWRKLILTSCSSLSCYFLKHIVKLEFENQTLRPRKFKIVFKYNIIFTVGIYLLWYYKKNCNEVLFQWFQGIVSFFSVQQ